jgi:hypothetical protein
VLVLLCTQTNMSNIIVGNRGRGCAVTAIIVALILMTSSAAILTTTTEAFAATKDSNKYCKDIQFHTLESISYVSTEDKITIGTSQDEYPVKIDYVKDSGDEVVYLKNVAARDPPGKVLLPEGETITITLQTNEPISNGYRTSVTLYNDKVSDCETILFGHVKDEDKLALKIVSIEQTDEYPRIAKLTVQVPDASDVDKHFTKLAVSFPFSPEAQEYYIISHRVQVSK